ncbi:MAG: TIGR03621 family F420-dependent LLM class oxidoreductase, partial [Acidimicrobiia bacterium]
MAHDRRFRFGVIARTARPGSELASFAREVEDLGYSTLYFPDHFVDHPIAPVPAMAYVAAATSELRVGTLVLGNDYKHPVVLANEAATIDLLSDGRLELGVGAGWMTEDYDRGGFTLDPAGVRIARLDASLTVMKGLMADGPFTFHGDHYRIDALEGEPKPVQRPHPPIVVGGGGPKVLALAAKHAQIVGIN